MLGVILVVEAGREEAHHVHLSGAAKSDQRAHVLPRQNTFRAEGGQLADDAAQSMDFSLVADGGAAIGASVNAGSRVSVLASSRRWLMGFGTKSLPADDAQRFVDLV